MNDLEHFFQCPYCWQNISMILEANIENQEYIEDCEVCCQPIKISFSLEDSGELNFFYPSSIEQ